MPQASAVSRLPRLAVVLLTATLVTAPLAPARADSIADAQQRARVLRQKLDLLEEQAAASVAEFETIHEDLEQAVSDVFTAQSALDDAQAKNATVQDTADDRVRAIYKSGGRTAMYAAVLQANNPHEVLARVANISAIVNLDATTITRSQTAQRRARIAVAKFEQATIARQQLEARAGEQSAEIERLMAAQQEIVAGADAQVQALIEEQRRREALERQRAAEAEAARLAALSQSVSLGDLMNAYQPAGGTYACPTGGSVNFINSWHFARSGGRLHQGTDMFAPEGSGAYAVTDGVVDKWGNGGLGGITLWIRAANGDRYYYAHNAVNLVSVGTAVKAGQLVALVGRTGNAAATPAHIHFEAHPGGGAAANPYPFLAAICGKF